MCIALRHIQGTISQHLLNLSQSSQPAHVHIARVKAPSIAPCIAPEIGNASECELLAMSGESYIRFINESVSCCSRCGIPRRTKTALPVHITTSTIHPSHVYIPGTSIHHQGASCRAHVCRSPEQVPPHCRRRTPDIIRP